MMYIVFPCDGAYRFSFPNNSVVNFLTLMLDFRSKMFLTTLLQVAK